MINNGNVRRIESININELKNIQQEMERKRRILKQWTFFGQDSDPWGHGKRKHTEEKW